MQNDTDQAAAILEIEIEARAVEANGWAEAGTYYTAYFRRQPSDIRGCPAGRSQHSEEAAIADLIRRTNDESGTQYARNDVAVTRRNGQPVQSDESATEAPALPPVSITNSPDQLNHSDTMITAESTELAAWVAFQAAVRDYRNREIEWTEYNAIRESYLAAADALTAAIVAARA